MGQKLFTLSFDDGTEQDSRLIALMEKYGIKGTFNISSGIFGRKSYIKRVGNGGKSAAEKDILHPELYVNHYILTEKDALSLYSSPNVEIASHGTHHLVQSDLTKEQTEEEITQDFERLSELFGYRVVGHAFPKDTFNGNVIEALKRNGALYARRVSRERPKDFSFNRNELILMPTCRHTDPFSDELLNKFINTPAGNDDMVFVLWGHSYELDYGTKLGCYEHIERLFQTVSHA
ncbi:MAG: polysaccharide deacetylase family protein, partial [Ruminococcus sp.]|nr:polysaccharide deacetylase family protein [Ruminococcus sp.]